MSSIKKAHPVSIATGVFSRKTMGSLFRPRVIQQGAPAMPAGPTEAPSAVPPPPPMPTPDDEAVKASRRRSVATQRARKGRLSTIFTDPGEGLGG